MIFRVQLTQRINYMSEMSLVFRTVMSLKSKNSDTITPKAVFAF